MHDAGRCDPDLLPNVVQVACTACNAKAQLFHILYVCCDLPSLIKSQYEAESLLCFDYMQLLNRPTVPKKIYFRDSALVKCQFHFYNHLALNPTTLEVNNK